MTSLKKLKMCEVEIKLKRIQIMECKLCRQAFTKRSDYEFHLMKHKLQTVRKERNEKLKNCYQKNKPGYEKRLQCDECDMMFVERTTLNAHSALHKPFPYVCHCGVGYYVIEDLKSHVKLVHPDDDIEESKGKENNKFKPKKEVL